MYDNTPTNYIVLLQSLFEDKGMEILWPTNLLYLNPIKSIWGIMGRLIDQTKVIMGNQFSAHVQQT